MAFVVLGAGQELNHRHEGVGGDSCENVPPAVQFKENTPRQPKPSFQTCDTSA